MTRLSCFKTSLFSALLFTSVLPAHLAQASPTASEHHGPKPLDSSILHLLAKSDPADGFTGSGNPDRRSSGGSRGSCDDLLVALVPGDRELAVSEAGCNLPSGSMLALTATDTPVFWFHVPAQDAPVTGEFALLDENQIALAVETVSLP